MARDLCRRDPGDTRVTVDAPDGHFHPSYICSYPTCDDVAAGSPDKPDDPIVEAAECKAKSGNMEFNRTLGHAGTA